MELGFINERLYEATRAELPTIRHELWRKYDSVDTLRFWALRRKEGSLIKSTPEQIIGADFRSLEELKRELKES